MPALLLRDGTDHGVDVLRLEPAAARSIGLACLDKNSLSPAARQLYRRVRSFAATLP